MSDERILGPYVLQSELGSGGMGTVYLAEAREEAAGVAQGAQVALKLVHPQLVSSPGFFKRFMREADVGKRIRHENVVRTYDVDATEFEGRMVLYLVMEYVEGRTLRELLRDLGTVPEALLREISSQISAGLASIHGQGIIHRDLKPENVLITRDQQVQIMDLGVAKLQEASVAITREGQFAGSFLYAAPEQFRSENVGPPVDLYSLGVVLHELATGENPFRGDDPAAVIHAHLARKPSRVSEVISEISEFTSEVIATLLEKKPEDRFDSSESLRTVLEAGEDSPWWKERSRKLRRRERKLPRIQLRRETSLIGRDAEMKVLVDAWEQVRRGEGSTVLVEGEPGIGKTRLIDAFLHAIDEDELHVLYGSYPPSGGLGGISDAILGKFGATNTQEALQPYLTVTPSLVPAFVSLVRHESAPSMAEPLHGDALHAVCCHLMQALAVEHPTVWILDDLNFAPEDSLHLALSLARSLAAHRVLLILTSTPGLSEDDLAHFGRLASFRRLPLARLGAREVVELLAEAFKSRSLAEKLAGKIGYKSDGVPFFIFEMVRGLKEGSFLRARADGSWEQTQAITDIEVPSAVRDLIEARLRDLTEEERNLLDVAAVQGFAFDPDLVGRVCEMRRVRVLQKLATLERRVGVVQAAGVAYRFDHNQIQAQIYAALSPGLRKEYHEMLGEAMAEREGVDPGATGDLPGETAYFLAFHGLQGSTAKTALPYLRPALQFQRSLYRKAAAVELADMALAAPGLLNGRDRVDLMLVKAACLPAREQALVAEEACTLAGETGDPALLAVAHQRLGSALVVTAQYDKAREHLHEALRLATEAGSPLGSPLVALGSLAGYLGEYESAREHFAAALDEAGGDAALAVRPMWGLGRALWVLGLWDEARTILEKLLVTTRKVGDKEAEAGGALNILGALYAALGDPERGRALLEQAESILLSIGSRSVRGFELHGLAAVAAQQGDLALAERRCEEALTLRRETGQRHGEAETLIQLAEIKAARGEPEAARPLFEEARDLATEIGVPGLAAAASVYLDGAEAAAALREHESHLDVTSRMKAHLALSRATNDLAHLEEAHQTLRHLRDHAPEEFKDSMIENVPLHREIMEAYGAR